MTKKKPIMSFEEWKTKAQKHADKLEVVGGDVLWQDDDPYDLLARNMAMNAFQGGQSPADFIEEAFEEDIASRHNDDDMAAEAMEWED